MGNIPQHVQNKQTLAKYEGTALYDECLALFRRTKKRALAINERSKRKFLKSAKKEIKFAALFLLFSAALYFIGILMPAHAMILILIICAFVIISAFFIMSSLVSLAMAGLFYWLQYRTLKNYDFV